jgi:predicted RNA-binding protein
MSRRLEGVKNNRSPPRSVEPVQFGPLAACRSSSIGAGLMKLEELLMCQATAYLGGKEIMRDVLRVELLPEGVQLTTFFEPPRLVPATLREIDLLKHRVFLEPLPEQVPHD